MHLCDIGLLHFFVNRLIRAFCSFSKQLLLDEKRIAYRRSGECRALQLEQHVRLSLDWVAP